MPNKFDRTQILFNSPHEIQTTGDQNQSELIPRVENLPSSSAEYISSLENTEAYELCNF